MARRASQITRKALTGEGWLGKLLYEGALPAAVGTGVYAHQRDPEKGVTDWTAFGKALAAAYLTRGGGRALRRKGFKTLKPVSRLGGAMSSASGPPSKLLSMYEKLKRPVFVTAGLPAAGAVGDLGEEAYFQLSPIYNKDTGEGALRRAIETTLPGVQEAKEKVKQTGTEAVIGVGQAAEDVTQVGQEFSKTIKDPEKRAQILKDIITVGGDIVKQPRVKYGLAALAAILLGYGGYKAIAPMKQRWRAKSEDELRQLRIAHARRKLQQLQQLQGAS